MYKIHAMESMELDDEDKLDAIQPIPTGQKPDFPYGLKICLTHKELAKLNLDPQEAEVGGTVHLFAIGTITSVTHNDGEYGYTCRVEIQIEKLSIESEDEENESNQRGEGYYGEGGGGEY